MGRIHAIPRTAVQCLVLCWALSSGRLDTQAASLPCSDVNGDEVIDLSDAVSLLDWLFAGGPSPACREALTRCGEVNGDDELDLSDAVTILGWLFLGSDAPECWTTDQPQLLGFTSLGRNTESLPEYRHDATRIEFVSLPGGKFWMGAQRDNPQGPNYDPDADDGFGVSEGPVREVTMSPFLIAKYEVTQRQWLEVMGENPSWYQPGGGGASWLPAEVLEGERWLDLPVEGLSCIWEGVQLFVETTGFRVPSEEQWEYACRAGVEGPISGTGALEEMGWCSDLPFAVGIKPANQFGIHDMHGNVWELCESWMIRGGGITNHEGPTYCVSVTCRSAHRQEPCCAMCCCYQYVGLRPVVPLP